MHGIGAMAMERHDMTCEEYVVQFWSFAAMPDPIQVNSDKTNCCSCGACRQVCPRKCIEMLPDPDGFFYPRVDLGSCLHCGKCRQVCHYQPGSYHYQAEMATYYVARASDAGVRQGSSSGGLFPILARQIMRQNGVFAGVRFDDDFQARLIVGSTVEQLEACRGSKYMQCQPHMVYREVRAALQAGQKVLFSGAPCLVAGLYAYLGEAPPLLYTVDFICHGTPSAFLFRDHLRYLSRRYHSSLHSLTFRDKTHGWQLRLKAVFANGSVYNPECLEDPFYHLFLASMLAAPACFRCPFTKATGRESDITLGDAWKAPQRYPAWNDGQGASLVIVNTSQGRELFQQARQGLECYPCELELIDQRHLHQPPQPHPDRKDFFRCWHDCGIEKAWRLYARDRPLMRRLKTRLRKIGQTVISKLMS